MPAKTSPIVTCSTCVYGRLHRYGSNPLLAACERKPQQGDARFPFVVEVANAPRRCSLYQQSPVRKVIENKARIS